MSTAWPTTMGDSGSTHYLAAPISPPLSVRWNFTEVGCGGGISDGRVLVVAAVKYGVLCLDLGNGSIIWSNKVRQEGTSGYGMNPDALALCAMDGELIFVEKDPCVVALDKRSGKIQWMTPKTGDSFANECMVAQGYLGVHNLGLSVANGKVRADFWNESERFAHKGISNGNVWCYGNRIPLKENHGGYLTRYTLKNRKKNLDCEFQAPVHELSNFAMNDRFVVYRMTEKKGELQFADQTIVRDAVSGSVITTIPGACAQRYCLAGDKLVFGPDDAEIRRARRAPGLVCYDVRNGQKLWELAKWPTDSKAGNHDYWWGASPIATREHVWATYPWRDQSGKAMTSLVALELESGKVVWEAPFPRWWSGQLLAAGDCIVAIGGGSRDGDRLLCCFGPKGTRSDRKLKPAVAAAPAKSTKQKTPARSARRPVRENPRGEYLFSDGRVLVLKPASGPRTVLLRQKDGKERKLLDLKQRGVTFDGVDVHAAAGTAFLRPCLGDSQEQELYVFDGQALKAVGIKKDYLNCISFAIAPEGKRVACAFTFPDEPDDAQVRVFDLSSGRELRRVELHEPTILATNLFWQSDRTLRFVNANSGTDTCGHHFELDLESADLVDLDEE